MSSDKYLDFSEPVSLLSGVGPSNKERLAKLNIFTLKDLLYHFPSRFIDFSKNVPLNELKIKKPSSFVAKIEKPTFFYSKKGKHITLAKATNPTGQINLVWFNSPYLRSIIKPSITYIVAGTPSFYTNKLAIFAPQVEIFNKKNTLHTQGLVPIYPLTKGISSKWIRTRVHDLLKKTVIPEDLPQKKLKDLNLPTNQQAFCDIHLPTKAKDQDLADKRISFNEHLKINLQNLKQQEKSPPSIKLNIDQKTHLKGLKNLPFKLTLGQRKALKDCYKDLNSTTPNRRLIHGDTGSGKTAVLILLANQCIKQNLSFAILAPTKILAKQHQRTFKELTLYPNKVNLITSETKNITTDRPQIYIGTHALISNLPLHLKHPLAVLAVDEQHKFGVKQRQFLEKRVPSPHIINLSATPIPRTVALSLFGEIKISTIKDKPRNRKPVKTWIMDKQRLQKGKQWLSDQLEKENKVFVVCPNIKSSKMAASVEDVLPIYKKDFPNNPIWSLHGQTPAKQKDSIIKQFINSKNGLLVATPLIEVGIDIPQANIIVIHSAERFGLAQLHQLRGRVGRGHQQGYCLVIPSSTEQLELDRLDLLARYSSGLHLAKLDLKLRGAGNMFGQKQHGHIPVRLKYFWNKELFQQAKSLAKETCLKTHV
jgi:ATP-dependent DNA helicase RecG